MNVDKPLLAPQNTLLPCSLTVLHCRGQGVAKAPCAQRMCASDTATQEHVAIGCLQQSGVVPGTKYS